MTTFRLFYFLLSKPESVNGPLVRSNYSLMAAAVGLSLRISEIRLMNQQKRLNSLIQSVKSSGGSNKTSNIS